MTHTAASPHASPARSNASGKLLKIGCFGSAIAYLPTSQTCQGCNLRDRCVVAVTTAEKAALEQLRRVETGDYFGSDRVRQVDDLEKPKLPLVAAFFERRRVMKDKAEESDGDKRAKIELANLVARGVDVGAMSRGENPFTSPDLEGDFRFLEHAAEFILKAQAFTRSDVAEALRGPRANYQPATARRYAAKSIALLVAAGVVVKEGKVYCLPK